MRAPRAVGIGLAAAGGVTLVALAWVRLLSPARPASPGAVALAAVGVLGLTGALTLVGVRHRTGRRRAVGHARPGWILWEVRAVAGFARALVTDGVWESRLSPLGGTAMTMAISPAGLEVWRGGRRAHPVASWPWSSVASITPGTGGLVGATRPAVVIETMGGAQVALVPAIRPTSGSPARTSGQAAPLLALLRASRDARER